MNSENRSRLTRSMTPPPRETPESKNESDSECEYYPTSLKNVHQSRYLAPLIYGFIVYLLLKEIWTFLLG